ncbi:MAG: hypothetical protein AAGL10_09315 [Pseudomonadota bacterium]
MSKWQITSKVLIDEPSQDLFDNRKNWILNKAQELGLRGKNEDPYLNNLNVITRLRELKKENGNITITQITEDLAGLSVNGSESLTRHLWAGTYQSFEKAMLRLPLEEIPE